MLGRHPNEGASVLAVEARWIASRIAAHVASHPAPRILNVGSQDERFRATEQPYVDSLIFAPLRERAVSVTHVDLFPGDGVDDEIDVTAPDGADRMMEHRPTLVLVSNLLEHVEDLGAARRNLQVVGLSGAEMMVTGPRFFPHHPDPIDNGLRPSKYAVRHLFPRLDMREHAVLWCPVLLTCTALTPEEKRDKWRWLRNQAHRGGEASLHHLRPVAAFVSRFGR